MNHMIRSVFNGILVKFQALELLILMLFCFATPLFAQATFEDALDKVLAEVVRDRISEVEVSALRSPLRRGSMEVRTWGDRVIKMPFEDAWVFMVDDAPLANWAHPCRYVFVAKDLSEIVVQRARTPLHVRQVSTRRDGIEPLDEALEVVVPYDYEQAATRKKKRTDPQPSPSAIRYDGNVENCYAVIISGGANLPNNHIRYWGDSAFIYSTLTRKYGYPKENIYVLISDGLDPAPDRSDDTNSPFDLDGDGLDDTMFPATRAAISNVFVELQGLLTTNDQLFIFLTDHGAPTADGGPRDVHLNLWNLEVLHDYELRELTEPIAAPIIFAMEQCHSGGFIYDLDQPNRAVATAAYYDESSWAGTSFPYFNQWAYYWTAAMRGFFPKSFEEPWEDGDPADADYNGDGFVSFEEAYRFAFENKFLLDNPMYGENPAGMGQRMFLTMPDRSEVGMGTFLLDPVGPSHDTSLPLDLRVVAANVFGDTITNYTGEVTLWAEAQPIDPGHYVGTGNERWTFPFHTDYMDARTQVIYPADLIGEARTLDHLSLELVSLPGGFVNNWTIRMKHTTLDNYEEGAGWEADGWTVVYQSDLTEGEIGWGTFMFDTPFAFNGTDNLMVDFSFFNTNYTVSGKCHATEAAGFVSMFFASDNDHGDPLDWAGSEPPHVLSRFFPNLRFGPPPVPVEVRIAPTTLSGFASGVATGQVWVLDPAGAVRIRVEDATNASWHAETDWFEALPGPCPTLVEVTSDPAGADIYLDYWPTGEVTPATINVGEVGDWDWAGYQLASHVITLKKAGHPRPSPQTVPAVEAETVAVSFDLTSSATGAVSVVTTPEGAEVYVDYADAAEGVTPIVVGNLAPGAHTILLRKVGYLQPRPIVAWVWEDETTEVAIPLEPDTAESRMMAEAHSVPQGIPIYIDYLPSGQVTDAVVGLMDPASHTGSDWHSASHTILLRREGMPPMAPRYVPDMADTTHWMMIHLTVDPTGLDDSNGDGIPDWIWEQYGYHPNNPPDVNAIADASGMTYGDKLRAGLIPGDPNSRFEMGGVEMSGDLETGMNITFVFDTVPGRRYVVQAREKLTEGGWTNISGVITATAYQTVFSAQMPGDTGNQFYRLIVLVP